MQHLRLPTGSTETGQVRSLGQTLHLTAMPGALSALLCSALSVSTSVSYILGTGQKSRVNSTQSMMDGSQKITPPIPLPLGGQVCPTLPHRDPSSSRLRSSGPRHYLLIKPLSVGSLHFPASPYDSTGIAQDLLPKRPLILQSLIQDSWRPNLRPK